jgi:hypothetical protein
VIAPTDQELITDIDTHLPDDLIAVLAKLAGASEDYDLPTLKLALANAFYSHMRIVAGDPFMPDRSVRRKKLAAIQKAASTLVALLDEDLQYLIDAEQAAIDYSPKPRLVDGGFHRHVNNLGAVVDLRDTCAFILAHPPYSGTTKLEGARHDPALEEPFSRPGQYGVLSFSIEMAKIFESVASGMPTANKTYGEETDYQQFVRSAYRAFQQAYLKKSDFAPEGQPFGDLPTQPSTHVHVRAISMFKDIIRARANGSDVLSKVRRLSDHL